MQLLSLQAWVEVRASASVLKLDLLCTRYCKHSFFANLGGEKVKICKELR